MRCKISFDGFAVALSAGKRTGQVERMLLRHSISGFRSAVSALHRRGVQRGEAPLRSSIFPQEWGITGVDVLANLGNATDRADAMDYETKVGG